MGGGGNPIKTVANAVAAPVKAIATAVASPVKAAVDIAQGKNVGQSLANIPGSVAKATADVFISPTKILAATPVVGPAVNAVTGNLLGSTTALGTDVDNALTEGGSAGNWKQDAVGVVKGAAIVGAEVATAGAVGGAVGIGAALGAGNLTGKLLNSGQLNPGDALAVAGDVTGNGDLNTAAGYLDFGSDTGAPRGAGSTIPSAAQQGPYYIGTPTNASGFSPLAIVIPLAVAGAVLIALRKGKI